MDRVVDLILAILSSQVPEGKGWFARVVNGIKVAVYLTFVAIIVSLPLAAIGSMVWERWDEMPFGLRSVVGFLGLLFVVTAVGSIGLFVKRLVCPAPGKGSEGSEADRATWRQ